MADTLQGEYAVDQPPGEQISRYEEKLAERGEEVVVGDQDDGQEGGVAVGGSQEGGLSLRDEGRGIAEHVVVDVRELHREAPVLPLSVAEQRQPQQEGDEQQPAEVEELAPPSPRLPRNPHYSVQRCAVDYSSGMRLHACRRGWR